MSTQSTHPDFEDFLRLLEEQRVDYMIVGGYAVAFHGFPRFTKTSTSSSRTTVTTSPDSTRPLSRSASKSRRYRSRCCSVPTRSSRSVSSP